MFGELEKYFNVEDHTPPLVQFALIHYQFETLHPFNDGNGRFGRLLISLFHGIAAICIRHCFNIYFCSNRRSFTHSYTLRLAIENDDELCIPAPLHPKSDASIADVARFSIYGCHATHSRRRWTVRLAVVWRTAS